LVDTQLTFRTATATYGGPITLLVIRIVAYSVRKSNFSARYVCTFTRNEKENTKNCNKSSEILNRLHHSCRVRRDCIWGRGIKQWTYSDSLRLFESDRVLVQRRRWTSTKARRNRSAGTHLNVLSYTTTALLLLLLLLLRVTCSRRRRRRRRTYTLTLSPTSSSNHQIGKFLYLTVLSIRLLLFSLYYCFTRPLSHFVRRENILIGIFKKSLQK